jgi:dolichol kinase
MRISRVAPLGEILHQSLQVFLDEKDTGPVILSHIYLLLGCALPLWLYPGDMSNDVKNGMKTQYSTFFN